MTKLKGLWRWLREYWRVVDEQCPHCGYLCTGKTIFCTKGLVGDPRKEALK